MWREDLTTIEILGLAIRAEMEAQKFYRKFAQLVENPLVKQRILDLAKEEGRHKQMLLSRYRALTEEAKPPIPKYVDRGPMKALEENASKEALLKIAIVKEQEAYRFYSRAYLKAQDFRGKLLLEYLASFEEGHQRALEAELKAMKSYPHWLDDEEGAIMLVGP